MDKKLGTTALRSDDTAARRALAALRARFALAPDDLLRDPVYRRLWTSVLTSSLLNANCICSTRLPSSA